MKKNIRDILPFVLYLLGMDEVTSYTFKAASIILNIPEIGRNKLIDFLKWKEILDKDRIPSLDYLSNGCFEFHIIQNKGFSIYLTTVTSTGIELIRELIAADFEGYLVYRKAKYQRYKKERETRQRATAQLMQG